MDNTKTRVAIMNDENMHQDPHGVNNNNNNMHQEPYEGSESQTYGDGEEFENEPQQPHEHDPYNEQEPYSQTREGQVDNNMHQEPYTDDSHSQTYGEGEVFEDEPQQPYGHDPYYEQRQPFPQPNEGQYDDLRYDNSNTDEPPFEDHDPYTQRQYHQSHPDDGVMPLDDDNLENQDQPEQAPPDEPRKHKYSTSNMQETGKCKKYCCILATLLFFLAIMIGISMLFNHFFFGGKSDNGPQTATPLENTTFPKEKQDVDSACSSGTFAFDQGALCKETCAPQFFDCCDPFNEMKLYNNTDELVGANTLNSTAQSSIPAVSDNANTTFLNGSKELNETCSFDKDLRGCMAYAKCQALTGQTDPAPATLPDLCSFKRLKKDPGGCQDLCKKLDCCYSSGSDNCIGDKFDLCMDYAPCQNLRNLNDPTNVLETAPRTIDHDCLKQLPACKTSCELAKCCGDPKSSCLQNNFMACLTYAPCNNVTDVNITLTPQFSVVSKPPDEIVTACNNHKGNILKPTTKSCNDYCTEAACCWDQDPNKNCFNEDPLGCTAWDAQCQALLNL
jgi:hypothetical protein